MASTHALIGVGGIGGYHLASLQKLARRDITRLVAVVEPRMEPFAELRRQLQDAGIRWYSDYHEMLTKEADLDAVTIATPIPLHYQMTAACLERGVHVNLEKPPVPLIQQLKSLIELDKQHRVTVGFQMIVSRCVQRMKQLIVDGTIGDVQSIRACGCWPRSSRYYQRANWAGKLTLHGEPVFDGPATNALAHVVHNIMFLAAAQPEEFAVPTEVKGELYRARPIESYDAACLRGSFPGGTKFCLAVAHCTRETVPFRIEVRGSKSWLLLSEDGARLETGFGEVLEAPENTQHLLDIHHQRFAEEISRPDRRPFTSLKDTLGYVRATNGLFLSSGGVHDITPEWVACYSEGDDMGYDVRGLSAMVERAFAEGRLFSEMGVEWATARPVTIRLDGFQQVELKTNVLESVA